MSTPFTEVYNSFLGNVRDYSIATLYQNDPTAYEQEMRDLLLKATVNFPNASDSVNSISINTSTFEKELAFHEIVILGKLMAIEYLTPFILDETVTRLRLNSRDYRTYSQGNHAQALQNIKTELHNEVNRSLSRTSYSLKSIKELFGSNSW